MAKEIKAPNYIPVGYGKYRTISITHINFC